MNVTDLEVPRIVYKGRDDQGALPRPHVDTPMDQVLRTAQETDRLAREELERLEEPTQTCRVETHAELAQKLKDGWRLHRTLDKAEIKQADASREEATEIADEAAEAERVSVESLAQARDAVAAKRAKK